MSAWHETCCIVVGRITSSKICDRLRKCGRTGISNKSAQATVAVMAEKEASDDMNMTLAFDVYDKLVDPAAVAEHVTQKETSAERPRLAGGGFWRV
jgi:hypothetical protein